MPIAKEPVMFDDKHYVAILKSRAGEFDALTKLNEATRTAVTPLIELTPIPLRFKEGQDEPEPAKTIDQHVDWLVKYLGESWPTGHQVFVDGFLIEEEDELKDGSEPIGGVLRMARDAGVSVVPVVGLNRIGAYTDAVKAFADATECDVCVRVTAYDLGVGNSVDKLLGKLQMPPKRIHFIMDYGPLPAALFGPLSIAAPMQLNQLPNVEQWKTFTISASGFPSNLAEVEQYSVEEFSRTEWLLWLAVQGKRDEMKRLPTFGDYGVSHPEYFEFDPRKMRMGPKIKYTDDLRWIVAKGESFRKKSDKKKPQHAPAKEQYARLSKMIMEHDAWKRADFSWGDEQIAAAAAGNGRSDATTWVTVATVHHVVSVVRQLANLRDF